MVPIVPGHGELRYRNHKRIAYVHWLHWRLELERSIHYVTHMGPLAIRGGIHTVAARARVLAATFTLAAEHR